MKVLSGNELKTISAGKCEVETINYVTMGISIITVANPLSFAFWAVGMAFAAYSADNCQMSS